MADDVTSMPRDEETSKSIDTLPIPSVITTVQSENRTLREESCKIDSQLTLLEEEIRNLTTKYKGQYQFRILLFFEVCEVTICPYLPLRKH